MPCSRQVRDDPDKEFTVQADMFGAARNQFHYFAAAALSASKLSFPPRR